MARSNLNKLMIFDIILEKGVLFMKSIDDEKFMIEAINQAKIAYDLNEVPVGCVIVKNKKIIAKAYNSVEKDNNALMHAEIKAINEASQVIKNFRLDGCTMYVTLEPCVMCTGALVYSRISRIVFGSYDKKRGACGSLMSLNNYEGLNHKIEVESIMQDECLDLLQSFFRRIREENKDK